MPLHFVSLRRQIIKSLRSGIGKSGIILPCAFLAAMALGVMLLGMVYYLRETLQATKSQIGNFGALWFLSYIVGCLLVRPLFDSVRPRYLLAASTLGIAAFTLAMRHAASLEMIYALIVLVGLFSSLFWPPMMGWLSSDMEGARLSKALSRFNFSWSLGGILSPFLTGWLSEKSAELPIYVASGMFLLTSVLLTVAIFALPRTREGEDNAIRPQNEDAVKGRGTLLRYPAWVGLFTCFVMLGVIMNISPVWAKEDLGLTKSLFCTFLLCRAVVTTIGFSVLGRTTFWHYKGLPMILGQLCFAGMVVWMVHIRGPLALGVVLSLMGACVALSYTGSIFHGVAGSTRRAARMALHESLLAAGSMMGAFLGGIIYEKCSAEMVYWCCACVVLLGAIIQTGLCVWISRRERSNGGIQV